MTKVYASLPEIEMKRSGEREKELYVLSFSASSAQQDLSNENSAGTIAAANEHLPEIVTQYQDSGLFRHVFMAASNMFYEVRRGEKVPLTGDGIVLHPPLDPGELFGLYYVIVESLGFDADHDAAAFEKALFQALEDGVIADAVIPKSQSDRESIWMIREDLEHVVADIQPFQAFDVSMPVGEMENYMHSVREQFEARWPDGKICFLGHVGDGNLHIAAGCGSDEPGVSREVEHCVYGPLQAIGGSVSAEHGIGLEKKDFLHLSRSASELDLMRMLKHALDPNNILNPGKVLTFVA